MIDPTVETETKTACCYFCQTEIDKLDLDSLIHCSVRKADDGGIQWACPDCAAIHCKGPCDTPSS